MIGMLLEPLSNKILSILKVNTRAFSYRLWQMIRTTIVVFIGMMIFRSHRLLDAWKMFCSIFTWQGIGSLFDGSLFNIGYIPHDFVVLIVGIILIIIGMFIGNYVQRNKYEVKEKLKDLIDRM